MKIDMATTCSGFATRGCRTLFKSYQGASVHLSKCKGSPVALGVLFPDCGRTFRNKRGLGVHRSAHHPEQLNAERLSGDDRHAAGAANHLHREGRGAPDELPQKRNGRSGTASWPHETTAIHMAYRCSGAACLLPSSLGLTATSEGGPSTPGLDIAPE
ncbi:hypothetical protein J6590_083262 [Homalodisca vitripennis]|nr:hypothetical protein J6590_083262 [Homalodisca vitripennis]